MPVSRFLIDHEEDQQARRANRRALVATHAAALAAAVAPPPDPAEPDESRGQSASPAPRSVALPVLNNLPAGAAANANPATAPHPHSKVQNPKSEPPTPHPAPRIPRPDPLADPTSLDSRILADYLNPILNPHAVASSFDLSMTQLARWAAQPHIQAELAANRALCEERAAIFETQARASAVAALDLHISSRAGVAHGQTFDPREVEPDICLKAMESVRKSSIAVLRQHSIDRRARTTRGRAPMCDPPPEPETRTPDPGSHSAIQNPQSALQNPKSKIAPPSQSAFQNQKSKIAPPSHSAFPLSRSPAARLIARAGQFEAPAPRPPRLRGESLAPARTLHPDPRSHAPP